MKNKNTQTNNKIFVMSGQLSHLERRILSEFDFTLRDEVVNKLLDFVKSPIPKDFPNNMVIFNKQCQNYER